MKKYYVEGIITADEDASWYLEAGLPCTSPSDIRSFLSDANGEEVELWINCYGGDVWAAMAIYAELQDYQGQTNAFVTGLAASAATIVMLGCQTVEASIGAQIMIHSASTNADGDYHDMYTAAEQLLTANDSIAAIYVKKTGKTYDEIRNLVERTTWFSAQTALDNGFIDSIVDFSDQRLKIAASYKTGLAEQRVRSIRDRFEREQQLKEKQQQKLNLEKERF